MAELAIPDPRYDVVPAGWWELALAEVETINSWEELDEFEARLRAVANYVEALSVDAVEYEKALRCVEMRRALLLGQPRPGERTDLRTRVSGGSESVGAPLVDLDVSDKTVQRWRRIADHWDDVVLPLLAKATKRAEVTQTQCLNVIREHTPARPDVTLPETQEGERWTVLHGDFRDRLEEVEAGSVDLIVTDPPYPKEDLALWSDLGKHAARLLAPRGLLFAWSGQLFLPEVLARLGEHLTYGWTFALMLPGSSSRIMGRHMVQAWKPVVAFSTGTWPSGQWGDDLLLSPERDKDEYAWQQNALPAVRLIERFSAPTGLVVDPFLGVGTFGYAAVSAGRRFIGVEMDGGRCRLATERIASAE